jgi:isoamylase
MGTCFLPSQHHLALDACHLQRLRQRQMRNMMVALMVAHGVPMMTMGDEYGHSKQGNNNTYCHDSELNWFNWQQVHLSLSGCAALV